jgi:hypothetical protein
MSRAAICWGDQRSPNRRSTSCRRRVSAASFAGFSGPDASPSSQPGERDSVVGCRSRPLRGTPSTVPGPDAPRPLGGTLPRQALARAPRVLRRITSGLIAVAPAVAAPRIGSSDVGSTWSSTQRRKPPPQMSGHRLRAVGSLSVQQRSTADHNARTAALVHPHVINTAHILADNVASIT